MPAEVRALGPVQVYARDLARKSAPFTGRRLIFRGNLHHVVEALDDNPANAGRLREQAATPRADMPSRPAPGRTSTAAPLHAYPEGLLPALGQRARHEGRPRYVPEDLDLSALPRSVRVKAVLVLHHASR